MRGIFGRVLRFVADFVVPAGWTRLYWAWRIRRLYSRGVDQVRLDTNLKRAMRFWSQVPVPKFGSSIFDQAEYEKATRGHRLFQRGNMPEGQKCNEEVSRDS